MAFRIAKPRVADIRKGQAIVSRGETTACGLCKKMEAKYSCPSCNVPYCSLECFRGEHHRDCSESFYRVEIEAEIKASPTRNPDERNQMMNILQRLSNEPDLGGNNDSDDEDIYEKLESLDINEVDTTTLWNALSAKQKDEFEKAMTNPKSSLAQQLLSSIEDNNENSRTPWWDSDNQPNDNQHTYPPPLEVPSSLLLDAEKVWEQPGVSLLYNILALCLSYVFCLRTLQCYKLEDLEAQDLHLCRQLLQKAVPFLLDRHSKTQLNSIEDAVTYVQVNLDELLEPLYPDLLILFRPPVVLDLNAHPFSKILSCLFELSMVLSKSTTSARSDKHAVHKLKFYAAHLMTAPSPVMNELFFGLSHLRRSHQSEGSEPSEATIFGFSDRTSGTVKKVKTGYIEELS